MLAHKSSLFSRLMRRVGLVMAIGAAAMITAAWYYARAAADDAYDRLLLGAALQMSEGLVVVNGLLDVQLPPSAFELLGLAQRDRIFYRVLDTHGQTLTGYDDLGRDIDVTQSRAAPLVDNAVYRGADVRIVTLSHPVSIDGETEWASLMVAQTTEARGALVKELVSRAVLLVALMCLLALVGTAFAIRYSLKPVADLGDVLARRDPQDLTPLSVAVPGELWPFVASINHFIRRLDERVRLMQRYVADSAHQIRTPLTALSAQVSLIDDARLAPEDRRHLERVRNRTAELARFTNQLLNHAMVIHRVDSAQLGPLSLNDVARAAFRQAIPITVDPDLVVSFEASEDNPMVMGDMLSLREAVVNIIDNALRHGVENRLDVRVERGEGCGRIVVEDDGPGIPPADWESVTQRFFSTRSQGPASGLGFAIASEVARALGGTLGFRQRSATTPFAVCLELPLIREATA
ncbi:sensor histidine kinase [Allorhizobium sp. BGMRC 0089]|nr:sensor histidine kinase [Allorhizobium sonneratiae]